MLFPFGLILFCSNLLPIRLNRLCLILALHLPYIIVWQHFLVAAYSWLVQATLFFKNNFKLYFLTNDLNLSIPLVWMIQQSFRLVLNVRRHFYRQTIWSYLKFLSLIFDLILFLRSILDANYLLKFFLKFLSRFGLIRVGFLIRI